MNIHRAKHALVIGLGQQAKGYLDALKPHDATMRTFWLADDSKADFPLNLKKDDLSYLYYTDETVRAWSSANWWGWQDTHGLLSEELRLSGKLALYQHHQKLDNALLAEINKLYSGQDVRLVVYLIAALHEPFASGALFDTAYLLHKLARERKGRLFTLLLLPGIVGEKAPMPEERQLQGATTYATLRELAFLLGNPSFYQPHPKLRIKHNGLIHNRSPFQSGDVFLIGGESVGDAEGGFRALQETDAHKIASAFVKLHSHTHLGDYLPHAERGSGRVSTFGLISQPAAQQERLEQALQHQRDAQKKQVYEALLYVNRDTSGALYEVTQAIDEARSDTPKPDTTKSLQEAFTRELERPQRSLAELFAFAERQSATVKAARDAAETEFSDLQKRSSAREQSLNRSVKSGNANLAALIVYLLPIWLLGAVLFLTLGWFVGFLIWLTLGLMPSWVAYRFEQSVYHRAKRQAEERQTRDAKAEERMKSLAQGIDHLKALQEAVDKAFPLAMLQSARDVVAQAAQALPALPANATPQRLADKELSAVKQSLLKSLVVAPLDATQLDALLTANLAEQESNRLAGFEMQLLREDLPQLKQQTLTVLGLDSSEIGGTQEHPVAILEVADGQTSQQHGARQTDMDSATQTHLVETPYRLESTPQRHFVRVRVNIPLWALMNINDWHKDYQTIIAHSEDNQDLFHRRAWLHPTRDGLATPQIRVTGHPLTAMIYVALLHLTESASKAIVEQLAQRLQVPRSTKNAPSYDELCGALQESDEVLESLLTEAYQTAPSTVGEALERLKDELRTHRRKPSQRYAAWEVWVYDIIARDFEVLGKRDETLRREMQRLVAVLYHQFTADNQHVRQ